MHNENNINELICIPCYRLGPRSNNYFNILHKILLSLLANTELVKLIISFCFINNVFKEYIINNNKSKSNLHYYVSNEFCFMRLISINENNDILKDSTKKTPLIVNKVNYNNLCNNRNLCLSICNGINSIKIYSNRVKHLHEHIYICAPCSRRGPNINKDTNKLYDLLDDRISYSSHDDYFTICSCFKILNYYCGNYSLCHSKDDFLGNPKRLFIPNNPILCSKNCIQLKI
uniref:Uncharacterized protein n=1 Tax=viral metagenome TaxID=1070528 RepID=A0A6C0H8T9_9ZZZZ